MESAQRDCHSWYALQVRPRFEKAVAHNLQSKGFEELLPSYRCRRQWSDRVKEFELPLFPGYVFCRFNIDDRFPILVVPGVTSIVGVGRSPSAIDEQEIENLRSVLESGVPYQPGPFISVGQTVSVEHGVLQGLEGIVTMVKNEFRLIISVSLLQRSVAVEINRDCVKPVNRPRPSSTENFVARYHRA